LQREIKIIMRVRKSRGYALLMCLNLCWLSFAVTAQSNSDSSFKPSGKLWGYTFGDFYYKSHSDALNRGGANQYTGIEQGRDGFQLRRAYLGYKPRL
jgi:hypothetical protein